MSSVYYLSVVADTLADAQALENWNGQPNILSQHIIQQDRDYYVLRIHSLTFPTPDELPGAADPVPLEISFANMAEMPPVPLDQPLGEKACIPELGVCVYVRYISGTGPIGQLFQAPVELTAQITFSQLFGMEGALLLPSVPT